MAAVTLLAGKLEVQGQVVTTWYQPTPYPIKKYDGTPMPEDIKVVHVWDGWFNNSSNRRLVRDEKLQIGGGRGEIYTFPIKFDLTGLPKDVDLASLYLYSIASGSANPSQFALWRIYVPWSPSTVGWDKFPYVSSGGFYWPVDTSVNSWRTGRTITGWYNDWKSGAHPDNGLIIWPYNNDSNQRMDKYAPSRATSPTDAWYFSARPVLRLDFTPTLQLKIPLPGKHSWFVTTEIGGWDCFGAYDSAHDDIISPVTGLPLNNYFSIDFASRNYADADATIFTGDNIPVIAAAGGKVVEVGGGNNRGDFNGFYIVIDHDKDGSRYTGFTTRYLHLRQPAAKSNGVLLKVGDLLEQGDQIGIMGSTGKYLDGRPASSATHLHFGVRFNDSGAKTVPELSKVIMEGKLLKSFQTECPIDINGRMQNSDTHSIRYYRSSNRVY